MRILFCLKGAALVRRASILLVVLALLAGMVGCVNGVENEFAGGSGTAGDPYQVGDWHHLDNVRHRLDAHFVLVNDLDSTTAGYSQLAGPEANEGNGWEPIQTPTGEFTGSFDGQGYEVRDLFIDGPRAGLPGLFSVVREEGVVENLGVVNANVAGNSHVGALVGLNAGTVSNCYSTGSVTGDWYVGGLVGLNFGGSVSTCYSAASVSGGTGVPGMEGAIGGLVGANGGTVVNSYSSGSVTGPSNVGGLVGWNLGTVSDCYSTGSVTGDKDVGGLVGSDEQDAGIVSNSFWDVEASGMVESYGGTGKTTAEMMDIATFTDTATEGLDEPWDIIAVDSGDTDDEYTWNIVDDQTYPFLSWEAD